jgi:hypothetical protein
MHSAHGPFLFVNAPHHSFVKYVCKLLHRGGSGVPGGNFVLQLNNNILIKILYLCMIKFF